MVLERAKFQVRTAQHLEELPGLVTNPTVDLLLLCHTLSNEDLCGILSYIDANRLNTKLLLITTVTRNVPEGPWETVDALAGAERMIDSLRHALAT